MNKFLSVLAAGSVLALSSNTNAFEYRPYVAADYTYTDAQNLAEVNGGKIALGTEYNKWFGTEVFYQSTGSDRVHTQEGTKEYALQNYGLDAYGYLPLGCDQVISLVGTAGFAFEEIKYKNPSIERKTEHGIGYRLGAGVEYDLTNDIALRALYRYTFTNHLNDLDHTNEYSLGVKYAF